MLKNWRRYLTTLGIFLCPVIAVVWSIALKSSNMDMTELRLVLSYPWQFMCISLLLLTGGVLMQFNED